ncbi:TonB-dependent receptor [Rhizosphaericola mali]|uniref:TonB-dependent receptor n=1 Tax=Rhizosphaericola mali TaxID=2545455 RepID=A0A5P2G841_9BACT|nr:TonB-dependent receptor [Rhizosphaericola mali]QES89383.1 TonB-dependent receptor [Rhizosphaericola mali]
MSVHLHSQTVQFSGKVLDQYGNPITNGSIMLLSIKDSSIIDYQLLGKEGSYNFTYNRDGDSILLEFKNINYATFYKAFLSLNQKIDIHPILQKNELKTLIVKSPPIVAKKDTLAYDVSSFASKSDRTLSDVLKKMPGIQVDESGRIRFQGIPINKFYVEGSDLMQGRYNIITNAMPQLDVSKVEVYQQHQPIKMLDGKIPSFQPALNIKLKKGISVSGKADVGIGVSPFLWNVKATPMLFTKPLQAVLDIQANNNGENLMQNLQSFTVIGGYEGNEIQKPIQPSIFSYKVSVPSQINQNRYLRNNTQSTSINILKKLKKDYEINFNAFYLHDRSVENGEEQVRVISINAPIAYTRQSNSKIYTSHWDNKITLTKNTNTFYLKENLNYQINANTDKVNALFDALPNYQNLNSPSYAFENSLSILIPLDKKARKMLNIKSFLQASNEKQYYQIDSIQNLTFPDSIVTHSNNFEQFLKHQQFETIHTLSLPLNYGKFTIVPSTEFTTKNEKDLSDLTTYDLNQTTDTYYNNHLRYNTTTVSTKLNINYEADEIKLSATLPYNYYNFKAYDIANQLNKNIHKSIFVPNVDLSYNLNNFWTYKFSYSKNYQFSEASDFMLAPIVNMLNLYSNSGNFSEIKTNNYSNTIQYNNPLHLLFANIIYDYTLQQNNLINTTDINQNGQSDNTNMMNQNNISSHSIATYFTKRFQYLKSSIKINTSNTHRSNFLFLNNELTKYIQQSNNYSLTLENTSLNWINFNYTLSYNYTRQAANNSNTYKIYNWKNKASIFLYPKENHQVQIQLNNSNYKRKGYPNQTNTFIDLSYLYQLKKKKIDLELKCQNLLNKNYYTEYNIQSIYANYLQYKLRERQIMATIRFYFRK